MEKNEFEKQLTDLFSGLKDCLRHRDIEARFFTHGMIMGGTRRGLPTEKS